MELLKKKKKVPVVEATQEEPTNDEVIPSISTLKHAGKRVVRVTRLDADKIEIQVESLETFVLSQEEFNRDVK